MKKFQKFSIANCLALISPVRIDESNLNQTATAIRELIMDNLASDFSHFIKTEFDLEVKPNELKKIIGNHSVMFKTFQIIMLKFKSKHNGEIIKRQLEIDQKRSKLNELISDLNKIQNELLDLIKVIDERKSSIVKCDRLKEFYELKQIRIKQLVKLLDQILKASEQELDPTINLHKMDKNIDLLNMRLNLEEIDDKYLLPPQIDYNLVEKQIDEFTKEINGMIFEIGELMKNEDFELEIQDDFIENLTRTDYKIDVKQTNENIETQHKDKRLAKLSKHYENYKERTENLYNKHKGTVVDLIKKVEEQRIKK